MFQCCSPPLTQHVPENSLAAMSIREASEVGVISVHIVVTRSSLLLINFPLPLRSGHTPKRQEFLHGADLSGHTAPGHLSAKRKALACWKSPW